MQTSWGAKWGAILGPHGATPGLVQLPKIPLTSCLATVSHSGQSHNPRSHRGGWASERIWTESRAQAEEITQTSVLSSTRRRTSTIRVAAGWNPDCAPSVMLREIGMVPSPRVTDELFGGEVRDADPQVPMRASGPHRKAVPIPGYPPNAPIDQALTCDNRPRHRVLGSVGSTPGAQTTASPR